MTKEEKEELIEKFKGYRKIGAVLLGSNAGSYAEGIDLPGDLLKGVLIVGLPLGKPDLETEQLIKYYDKRFKKGWEYFFAGEVSGCAKNYKGGWSIFSFFDIFGKSHSFNSKW